MTEPCPLQDIGAGPAGISLVLALCNRVAAAKVVDVEERRLLQSLQMIEAEAGGKMASHRINANANANTGTHDVVRGISDATTFADLRDQYLALPQTQSELIPLAEIGELTLQVTGFASDLPPIERDGCRIEVGNPTANGELRNLADNEIIPGLFGMGLGLNILSDDVPGEPSFNGGIHGFQSYPLAIAPRLIDCLTAHRGAEKVH